MKSKISTNREQVRSIEDQLAVLRSLAKDEGLTIAQEFIEKQSAKKPGRPVFNEMLARIEKGEAQGIIKEKISKTDLVLLMEYLYDFARTYFIVSLLNPLYQKFLNSSNAAEPSFSIPAVFKIRR